MKEFIIYHLSLIIMFFGVKLQMENGKWKMANHANGVCV